MQLAANGSSCLANTSPVLKKQRNLSVRSSSTHVVTTFDDAKGVSSSVVEEKIGVLLLNLGGPETLDDVQPFLFNLFADPVSKTYPTILLPLYLFTDCYYIPVSCTSANKQ